MVRLSASVLTTPQVSPFSGSIEVDITAEDLPIGDPRENAEFGKFYIYIYPSIVHYNNVCLVCYCPLCIVLCE